MTARRLASRRRHLYVTLIALMQAVCSAQSAKNFQYVHDDSGQLTKAIDANGNQISYTYDLAGNILQLGRGAAPASGTLSILSFTPQSGGVGSTVTIQGQNFSTTAASNAVTFNNVASTVVSATSTSIVATVPSTATTGPVTVTVGANTATSATNFTVISTPVLLTVSPRSIVSSSTAVNIPSLQVTGVNLTGSTFSFSPAFTPAAITVNTATINVAGTSATLNVTVAAGASGTYTLMATNASGASSPIATSTNTLHVLSPNNDDDGDGLSNAVEAALGTDPLNPQTSGAGLPDGWQVFYGLNPLDPASAGPDPAKSGNTALQDFQQGLSPRNPNRVPPAVSQVTPSNGATAITVNGSVVVRFAEPLLVGTSLTSAQTAITTSLGTNSSVSAAAQLSAAQSLQAYMNRTFAGNSVVPGTVTLTGPVGGVAGSVTPSSDGLSAVFGPATPLSANTTYTVLVNGVRDAAGNLMTTAFTSSFTTGTLLDSVAPTVVVVDPENNLTNVPTNVHYTIQFSKVMDPSTLTPTSFSLLDTTYNTAVAGTVQVDASGTTASFVPNQPLPIQHSFKVSLTTTIKDINGNYLAATGPYYFSTGYTAETTAPHFIASSPISGATGIPLNAIIDLQFSEPLDIPSVAPNIQVSTGGQAIPVMFALSSGDQRVTITPAQALQPNATYTVTIGGGIADLAGLTLDNAGSFTFQTGSVADTTTLAITSVVPANSTTGVPLNSLMRIAFNKPVDAASVIGGTVEVYPYSAGSSFPIAGSVAVATNGLSVTFTPASPLKAETQYCLYVNGIEDLEGTALGQNNQTLSCFITGTSAQTAGPAVVGVSPPNGATGVYTNALIQAQISTPIDTTSVGQNAITVTAGGVSVAGVVTTTPTVLSFKPAALLAANTAYTVVVGGFTDTVSNSVSPFTSSFTTGASANTVTDDPIHLLSITPANGSSAVPVTTPVVVTFNEAINPLTVNSQSIEVQANGTTVAGNYVVNGATITFTPRTPLPGGATVSVRIDYDAQVQDLVGNTAAYLYGTGTSTFTTVGTADTTIPTVVSVTPSNGSTGVGLNGQVVVVFSKSMNPSTLSGGSSAGNIALLAGGVRQSFNTSISVDNRTVVLSGLNLPASTVITLAIPPTVTDISGNALAAFTSEFTTAAAFDTTHGSVVSQRPANGATGVSLSASPVVLFVNKPLNASTAAGAMHVSQAGQVVAGTVAVVGNGQTLEFTPSSPWQYGDLVEVFLDTTATDTDGNTVNAYRGTFTTVTNPASTAPAVVNVSPASNATGVPLNAVVDVQYSEALTSASVVAANVYLRGPGGTIATTITQDTTGTILHLKPSSLLAANAQYCAYVQNAQGTNGLSAQNLYYCFTAGTTSATVAPTVVTVSPANGLSGVPLNANVGVTFSAPIDPTTVSGTTIQLSGGGMTSMPASISLTNNNQTVEIAPEAPLPPSTQMTLTISGVTDVAGNVIATHTTQFTTGTAAATAAPGVVTANPVPNATAVPLNAAISLQANAEIDGTSVTSSTFKVQDNTLNQYLSGTYSLSADGMTSYFLPAAQLTGGHQYTVYFDRYGMTDVAGNQLTYYCTAGSCLGNYSFTTGFAASTSAPQVTGVSPANNLTQVPINAQIVVAFNEPVNSESLKQVTLTANGTAVALTPTLSNGNQTLTLVPVAGLSASTAYNLTVAGVTDLSGNAMAASFTSTFTTSAQADLRAPAVATFDPANGATGVPLNALMRVGFNKAMDALMVGATNVEVYPYGVSGVLIPGTVSLSTNGMSATFRPASNLEAETQYCLYVNGIEDLEGGSLGQNNQTLGCFTTGASTQTTGPVVTGVSPLSGSTGAPVNALISVGLSEPVSAVSVGNAVIVVSAGGQLVAGTVAVGSGSTTLTFTPASPLAVSTNYTVTVGGFTDLAGNAVTAFTSSFTTSSSSTADAGPLQILSVTPANGSASIAVTTPVVVLFNEAVNPLTVNSGSVQIYANGDEVAGSYAVNGATVTFTPSAPLPGGATIKVGVDYYPVAYIQDLAGNINDPGSLTSFTTASTPDTTIPTVVSVTPSNGSTGVGLNGQVVVVFSKSMNPSTLSGGSSAGNIALLAGGVRQSFNTSISVDNRTVVLSGLNLPASTVITLAIPPTVTDISGNALAAFTSEFTTAAAFDTTHGSVVSQRPANGATGVSLSASPVVLFVNKPLNASTAAGAMHVSQAGQVVAGTVAVVGNGQTLEFTPSSPWQYGDLVEVFLDTTATDTDGNTVNAYRGTFTTVTNPASTAPAVVNVSPASNATGVPLNAVVDVQYSEALTSASVVAANVYLRGPGGTIATTITQDTTGTILHLKPSSLLAANAQYCAYVQNAQGTNGLSAQNLYYCFTAGTTSATVAPTVVTVSPANGLSGVPLNANVGVTFSAPIDPTTVSGTTIQLSGGGMTSMPASISLTNNNQTVEIAPEAPLPPSTQMTLTISGVTDVAGNVIATHTTQFTTGTAAATAAPGVVTANPVPNATAVPLNAAISLQANAEIDGTSVTSSTFKVQDNTLNQYLSGTYSLSADGMTSYFLPAAQLTGGHQYTVYFDRYGMTDVAGNQLTYYCTAGSCLGNYSFTTGFAASTSAPQVTGVSPANNLTQVPINAQIVVAFNEPVNSESLKQVTLTANGTAVALTPTLSNGNQTLTLVPVAGLSASTAYNLTVAGVTDLSGNAMAASFTSTFTTSAQADLRAPAVATFDPANGATGVPLNALMRVGFNKAMDALMVGATNVEVYPYGVSGVLIPGTVSLSTNGMSATFRPASNLEAETQYCLYVNGIEDLEGGSLGQNNQTLGCFTTGASTQTTGACGDWSQSSIWLHGSAGQCADLSWLE